MRQSLELQLEGAAKGRGKAQGLAPQELSQMGHGSASHGVAQSRYGVRIVAGAGGRSDITAMALQPEGKPQECSVARDTQRKNNPNVS